jgi:hypothetical protein
MRVSVYLSQVAKVIDDVLTEVMLVDELLMSTLLAVVVNDDLCE